MRKGFSENHYSSVAGGKSHGHPVMVWRVGANGCLKASWKMDDDFPHTDSNVIPFAPRGCSPLAGLMAAPRLSPRS